MKHTTLLILGCVGLAIASCGNPGSKEEKAETTETAAIKGDTATTVSAQTPAATLPGEALIAKADCSGCHNKTQKIVGPAFEEIAAKYPSNDANISHLADVVIKGGHGVWGEIPMTPHPNLSTDDAKTMVTWILSLKK